MMESWKVILSRLLPHSIAKLDLRFAIIGLVSVWQGMWLQCFNACQSARDFPTPKKQSSALHRAWIHMNAALRIS